MKNPELQSLSVLLADLPEGISAVRFYGRYQEAVRVGTVLAVPVGESFNLGRRKCKDDLVRIDANYERWYKQVVRSMQLSRARHGVVAHAEDVKTGTVDFEELAARYRDQLNQRVSVRAATKRPTLKQKRGKPKLAEVQEKDRVAAQPQPEAIAQDRSVTQVRQEETRSTGAGAEGAA